MLQIGDYLARAKPGFTVLAGAAPTLFTSAALGVHGAVLALAGIVPELCVELFEHVRAGRVDEARALQRRLMPRRAVDWPGLRRPGLEGGARSAWAAWRTAARAARAGGSSRDRCPAASARSTRRADRESCCRPLSGFCSGLVRNREIAGDTVSLGADPIDAHLGRFRRFSIGLRSSGRGTRVAVSCASGKSIRSQEVLPVLERS